MYQYELILSSKYKLLLNWVVNTNVSHELILSSCKYICIYYSIWVSHELILSSNTFVSHELILSSKYKCIHELILSSKYKCITWSYWVVNTNVSHELILSSKYICIYWTHIWVHVIHLYLLNSYWVSKYIYHMNSYWVLLNMSSCDTFVFTTQLSSCKYICITWTHIWVHVNTFVFTTQYSKYKCSHELIWVVNTNVSMNSYW